MICHPEPPLRLRSGQAPLRRRSRSRAGRSKAPPRARIVTRRRPFRVTRKGVLRPSYGAPPSATRLRRLRMTVNGLRCRVSGDLSMKRLALVLPLLFLAFALFAAPITLRVDATNVASNLYHAHLNIPATAGPMTLFYPKWIPGEHGPTGPINGLAGLRIIANGQAVTWLRDPVEMFAFNVDVPTGATSLDVDLDFLAPAPGANFTAGASTTPRLAVLSWNTVLLYPRGVASDTSQVDASLRIPAGWLYATALETRGRNGDEIHFEPATLTTVVASPVQLGQTLPTIDLA